MMKLLFQVAVYIPFLIACLYACNVWSHLKHSFLSTWEGREETTRSQLTEHRLQSDQTGDKVVKVDSHVLLRVAQDDQLEQVVGQLKAWRGGGQTG